MFTLTIDPETVDGPQEALELVQNRRSIAKLLQKLKRRKILKTAEYTVTLEFHKSGWPHWHVLVNASYVCKHKLQREWSLGNCWISKSKNDFESVSHAINYATKYIAKTNKEDGSEDEFGFPGWVLDWKHNLRRFSASRAISAKWSRKYKPKISDSETKPRLRITRTGREKTENCGKSVTILERYEKATVVKLPCGTQIVEHEESYKFFETIDKPWDARMATLKHCEIEAMIRREKAKQREKIEFAEVTPEFAKACSQNLRVYRRSKNDPATTNHVCDYGRGNQNRLYGRTYNEILDRVLEKKVNDEFGQGKS